MYKTVASFVLFLIVSTQLVAQVLQDDQTRLDNGEDLNVLYGNEATYGVYIHSARGFGIAYRRGMQLNVDRKRLLEIELNNYKHSKEFKVYNENSPLKNSGYLNGKLNYALILRGGVGFQNVIYKKVEKKNVEVSYFTYLGATVAFLKPVYIVVIDNLDPETQVTEKYDPDVRDYEHYTILGKASILKGVKEIALLPAGYAKFGFSYSYATSYSKLRTLETGIVVDGYPKGINMMAYNDHEHLLFTLYVKFMWGKKWF